MARLNDQLTPVAPVQVYDALRTAWRKQFDAFPHRTSLLVLLSQWALETGWGRSMHCFNLGNVKSAQKSGDWCFFRCNEIINGRTVWFEPDHPACCFRAFQTLDDGALDYLQTLHRRFQRAWPAVLAGDPAQFSHLLKRLRYYTADETAYTKTLVSLFKEFSRTLPALPPSDDGSLTTPLPDLYSVLGVQSALTALDFEPGALDGVEGPRTRDAIRAFQSAQGLVADGIVGRLTRAALARAWYDRFATPD
jgi:hypothetical protein